MSQNTIKKLWQIILTVIITLLIRSVYKSYIYITTPSKYEVACEMLGFNGYTNQKGTVTKEDQQEALLQIFFLSGYLKPEKIWNDINSIGGIKDPAQTFKPIYRQLVDTQAHIEDFKNFRADSLRKTFFGKITDKHGLSIDDVIELLIYISQNSFNKQLIQEKYEGKTENWINTNKQHYTKALQTLQLIERKLPEHKHYDIGIIHGASRAELLYRMVDYNYIIKNNSLEINKTIGLSRNRELWANIDGINPSILEKLIKNNQLRAINIDNIDLNDYENADEKKVNEARQYMKLLAQKNKIKLNNTQPFISYNNNEECPQGRLPNKIYANYAPGENKKLTEILMLKDLLKKYETTGINVADVIPMAYYKSSKNIATSQLSNKLIQYIKEGSFGNKKTINVLSQSNNPYTLRQGLVTQLALDKGLKESGLDKEGYKVIVEPVGFASRPFRTSRQRVEVINSELAILIYQRWKYMLFIKNAKPTREPKKLLFATRDKNSNPLPMPKLVNYYKYGLGTLINWSEVIF
jgi:hypothetical protein